MSVPGGGRVHVDHDAMAGQAARLGAARQELDEQLRQIQAQIGELVSTGFVTESASGSFADAHARWNTAAKSCIEELDLMGSYLKQTSGAFAQVDQASTVRL